MYSDRLPAKEDRVIWIYILIGFIPIVGTIIQVVLFAKFVKDLNRVCGYVEKSDDHRAPHWFLYYLLSFITFGIYQVYWYRKQGDRIFYASKEYGLDVQDKGWDYAFFPLLGVVLSVLTIIGGFVFFLAFLPFLPIVALGVNMIVTYLPLHMMFRNLNKMAISYNRRIGQGIDNMSGQANIMKNAAGGENHRIPAPRAYDTDMEDWPTEGPGTLQTKGGLIRGISGDYKGSSLPLSGGEKLIIGRSGKAAQLVVADQNVSKAHCIIEFDDNKYGACFYVTDNNSLNGTFLNNSIRLKPGERKKVPIGSRISLGNGKQAFMLESRK